jgi:hypothetical protein
MKIRYNLIFIPILIIVAFAVWYLGLREEKQQAAKRIADRALVDMAAIDIIEIDRPDQSIRLEKTTGPDSPGPSWRMVQPFEVACNSEKLTELTDTIQQAEVERDISAPTEEQLSEYGLREPPIRIKLMSSDGNIMMDLLIGLANPSGSSRYAKFQSSDSCFLLPVYDVRPLEVSADDLRDNKAVDFDQNDLTAMQLSSVQADIHFEKDGDEWVITSPQSFTASPARIDILFENVRELVAEEFLPADVTDPELSTTTVTLRLTFADGSGEDLKLHGEDLSRGIFATSSYQPTPFIVQSYIYDRLALKPDVFFQMDIIDFPKAMVGRIHVRQPEAENLEIERMGEGDEGWRILRPPDRAYTDPGDFTKFLDALYALQPEVRVPPPSRPGDYGTDPVYYLLIEIHNLDDTGSSEIVIGSRDPDGNYYATVDDRSFFTINSDLMTKFIEATDKLRGT